MLEPEFVAQDENAVTHKGESVIIDPKFMTVGVPQVFRFIDKYMVAVKAETGTWTCTISPTPHRVGKSTCPCWATVSDSGELHGTI